MNYLDVLVEKKRLNIIERLPLLFFYYTKERRTMVNVFWELGHLVGVDSVGLVRSFSFPSILIPACHREKPLSKASRIHGCRHCSMASGTVSQLRWRVLCSGQELSSSFTCIANIAALHKPSGLNSSWWLLLLKW